MILAIPPDVRGALPVSGVPNIPYYLDKVHRYLPQAELVVLNAITEFFERRGEDLGIRVRRDTH